MDCAFKKMKVMQYLRVVSEVWIVHKLAHRMDNMIDISRQVMVDN